MTRFAIRATVVVARASGMLLVIMSPGVAELGGLLAGSLLVAVPTAMAVVTQAQLTPQATERHQGHQKPGHPVR